LALAVTTATWVTMPATAFAEDDITEEYVALGDSFAAGPLILPQEELDPCFRSTVDYPHVLAKSLGVRTFRDVTCSCATTANILDTPQKANLPGLPAKPPQLDALTSHTTLVTVTIGANDIGLAGIALSCFNALPPPIGRSCKATQTAGGVDRGARAVGFIGPGAGHDGCNLTANWANVLVPGTTLGIVPIHPTALGERNFARILEHHLTGREHDAESALDAVR
jgi:peptidoglycan hydrolase-like protein with peptidoglycan-binding domain